MSDVINYKDVIDIWYSDKLGTLYKNDINKSEYANARTCFSGKRSVQCMERCMEHSSLHPAQCNSLC